MKYRIVSVPYWGSLYFNYALESGRERTTLTFPSPIGVLYISIHNVYTLGGVKMRSFRPLLGFFIFQFGNRDC